MRISDWSSDVCSSDLAVSPQQSPSPRGLAPAPPAEPRGIPPASQKARTPVTDLNIIDQFMAAFIAYIDSGFGLLGGDVSFLSRTLIAIDVTLAALFWAMGGEDNVLGRLIRKVRYVGAFAFILTSFSPPAATHRNRDGYGTSV